MIINALFSFSLFVSGGHVIDTKLSLHHYSDEDYKEIFYLKNKKSIFKECIRHSEFEDVKKIRRHRPDGEQETLYLIVPISSIISYIK
jgi:hypothetical protein